MHKLGTFLLEGFYDGYAAGALAVNRPRRLTAVVIDGVQNSNTTVLPFTFGKIRTTVDDLEACDVEDTKDVGKLHIDVWRATFGKQIRAKEAGTTTKADIADAAALYSEEHVKFKTDHVVALGKEQKVAAEKSYSMTCLDPKPLLPFCFCYLSKELLDLKIAGLIDKQGAIPVAVGLGIQLPRPALVAGPSHASEQERRVADKVQNAPNATTKKRKANATVRPNSSIQKEIKKLIAENERLKKHLKRNKNGLPGEIIDLTDD